MNSATSSTSNKSVQIGLATALHHAPRRYLSSCCTATANEHDSLGSSTTETANRTCENRTRSYQSRVIRLGQGRFQKFGARSEERRVGKECRRGVWRSASRTNE